MRAAHTERHSHADTLPRGKASHAIAIFRGMFTITVKTHGYTSVDITGMDIVLRKIEVMLYDVSKGIVSLLVGEVRAVLRQLIQLLAGKIIG